MINKTVLFLYHTDQDYILFHFEELKKQYSKVIKLHYADVFRDRGLLSMQEHIIEEIQTHRVDITFVLLYEHKLELHPEYLNTLRSKTAIVFWLFDDEILLQAHSKYQVQAADAVITTDFYGRYYYEQIGIPAILYYSSYLTKDYYPKSEIKDIDVSFVGLVETGDRKEYLDYLEKAGIHVEVYGSGTKNGFLNFDEMIDVFSRSKISLNFTQTYAFDWINQQDPLIARNRQNKGRPIELAMCKTFCLCEDAPSVKHVFKLGEEIEIFTDKEELLQKVNTYLKDDSLRQNIESNAYARALNEYQSDIYLSNVTNALEISLSKSKNLHIPLQNIYLSDVYKRRLKMFFLKKAYASFIEKNYNIMFKHLMQLLRKMI